MNEREAPRRGEARRSAPGRVDRPFLYLVLLLLAVGLVMLLSASYPSAYYELGRPTYYFVRQGRAALLGLACMAGVSAMDYHRLRGAARPVLAIAFLLLAAVLAPGVGVVRNNARRWISLGPLGTFQPSELAKLAVILDFSTSIAYKKDRMATWRQGIWPYLRTLLPMMFLMSREPHLSGAVLIFGVGAVLLFVGGIRWRWVGLAVLAAGGEAALLLSGVFPYGQSRIAMWRDPFIDAGGAGYQLSQSLISIGSGGLTGVGLGRSQQKFLFLPEEHNDFIFAIVCEELGLVGAVLILLLFAGLILRGFQIALGARDRFGSLLAVGVVSLLAMQTFMNIGVVTGLLPTTGVALPFFSYGGTALLLQLVEVGIVLAVSREAGPTGGRGSRRKCPLARDTEVCGFAAPEAKGDIFSAPAGGHSHARARGRNLWRKDPSPLDPHQKHGGKRAKRRQRRMKRHAFEETARLAARQGRESYCRDGASHRPPYPL